MLTHTMSSTSPTAPSNTNIDWRTLLTIASRSGYTDAE